MSSQGTPASAVILITYQVFPVSPDGLSVTPTCPHLSLPPSLSLPLSLTPSPSLSRSTQPHPRPNRSALPRPVRSPVAFYEPGAALWGRVPLLHCIISASAAAAASFTAMPTAAYAAPCRAVPCRPTAPVPSNCGRRRDMWSSRCICGGQTVGGTMTGYASVLSTCGKLGTWSSFKPRPRGTKGCMVLSKCGGQAGAGQCGGLLRRRMWN